MSRHRREVGLLAILARLGWQRDPTLWNIPCLDGRGRRGRLSVRLGRGSVTLEGAVVGPVYLPPLQAGRLLMALRHALDALVLLGGDNVFDAQCPGAELPGAEAPSVELPGQAQRPAAGKDAVPRRSVLQWRPVTRPTVADIQARLAADTAEAVPEVDHVEPASHPSTVAA